jgi:hypothetical protein
MILKTNRPNRVIENDFQRPFARYYWAINPWKCDRYMLLMSWGASLSGAKTAIDEPAPQAFDWRAKTNSYTPIVGDGVAVTYNDAGQFYCHGLLHITIAAQPVSIFLQIVMG